MRASSARYVFVRRVISLVAEVNWDTRRSHLKKEGMAHPLHTHRIPVGVKVNHNDLVAVDEGVELLCAGNDLHHVENLS